MRILMLGIALLALSTFAFAAPITASAHGDISLTVERFIAIDLTSGQDGVIGIVNDNQSGTAPLTFNYHANCQSSIAVAVVGTGTTNAQWSVSPNSVSPVTFPTAAAGVDLSVTVTAKSADAGPRLVAGSDTAICTATITAP